MSSNSNHSPHGGSSSVSHTPTDDIVIWGRLYELLSPGYHTLLRTPGLEKEITDLSNALREKIFLFADPFFIDLTWEFFSSLPSNLFAARQTENKIRELEPILKEANALDTRIFDESSQLSTLRKEHHEAEQLESQLSSDLLAAANIRNFFSQSIEEQGNSPVLERRLAQAERLIDLLLSLSDDSTNEVNDLAEIIQTKTHRLADLEVERAELQKDLSFYAHLHADFCTLETDLKVLVAKIGAYFRFM